jgi:hypothetical protein
MAGVVRLEIPTVSQGAPVLVTCTGSAVLAVMEMVWAGGTRVPAGWIKVSWEGATLRVAEKAVNGAAKIRSRVLIPPLEQEDVKHRIATRSA